LEKESIKEYKDGFIKGIPICLGYIPVSFTFGLMAVTGGLSKWLAIFTSLSNVTSAGQFAGVQLIFAGAGYFEIALTTFVINMRYMLMSLSLSQKIAEETPLWKRLIFGFAITDEIFAIASVEKKKLTASYMFGLMTTPIFGWTLGTALGAFTSELLPERLAAAMGIALYAMFIAIIIPPAKKSKAVMITILEATVIMCIFRYVHLFDFISDGFKIIIATIVAAGISAALFPITEDEESSV
jgi:predicted branched-subunit amino acid permease